jgi:glycosyltransferase involved in cell wall biosynthesis
MDVLDPMIRSARLAARAAAVLPGDLRRARGPAGVLALLRDRAAQVARQAPASRARRARSPLRLLLEVDTLDRGGLEECVYQIARHLDRSRFEPRVACITSGGLIADRIRALGVPVDVLGGSREKYASLRESAGGDVVHSHDSLVGAPLARRARIPTVHTLHNSYTWMDGKGAARLSVLVRDVSRFIAVSSSVARYARMRFALPEGRIAVVPNGVDVGGLAARRPRADAEGTRSRLALAPSTVVFLCVGTYEARKGYRALFAAFEKVAAALPNAVLVTAGNTTEPALRGELDGAARRGGYSARVRMLDYQEIDGLYASADVFVLPSVVEGASLSAIEALAFGLPIVLTDVGAARELLATTRAGILVPPAIPDPAVATDEELSAAGGAPGHVVDALARAMLEVSGNLTQWKCAAGRALDVLKKDHDVRSAVGACEDIFEECVV